MLVESTILLKLNSLGVGATIEIERPHSNSNDATVGCAEASLISSSTKLS
jgi:hypothetical protein